MDHASFSIYRVLPGLTFRSGIAGKNGWKNAQMRIHTQE